MAHRMLRAALLAGAAILVLAGCTANTSGYTVTEGKLTVCGDTPYPPFEYEDPASAVGYTGFDVDLASEIAQRLKLELVYKDVDFDALQSATVLVAGECDMGASAITITAEREKRIDFADPVYDSLQSLLVKGDSGIMKLDDLAGKRIGIQQGSTGQIYAEANAPKEAELVQFPSDGELWAALKANQIDAILQDQPVNHDHELDTAAPGFVIVETYSTNEKYGFAFAKDQKTELRADVNEQLAAMRADGTYDRIYQKYFS